MQNPQSTMSSSNVAGDHENDQIISILEYLYTNNIIEIDLTRSIYAF